ncbi:MAG: alpha-N-arabinofuranosidase [Clostridia bacterium]|nr:alpha-N-arabinofuranosidase [Clostridia bacterium]
MKAKITLDREFVTAKTDKRLYGSFIEHMGRAIYGGIYQPSHPTADENGFRGDVIELVKALNIPIIRYPGGNFLSNYNWEDGVGPVEKRPVVTDAAWQSLEPNLIGTDEFHKWAEKVGTDVMMAVNLGTGDIESAKNLIEYCNHEKGSKYSNMRVENGREKPYGDKVWCLGNEMDGPWQVGYRTMEDYADLARRTAGVMKMMDPSIELVACGSSYWGIPTFGKWELTVLEAAYDKIDYLSLHLYLGWSEKETMTYLGATKDMDRFIKTVVAICDTVKGIKKTSKTINLSFDEWNVQSSTRQSGNEENKWTVGPRREEYIYSMEDALVFGCMLITLINNSNRVKMACLAQLVNVAAPIMAPKDGNAWAQTTYYPFLHASNWGRGKVLTPIVKCPTYNTKKYGDVPYIETAAVYNEEAGEVTVFAVNRSSDEENELTLTLRDFSECEMIEHIVMSHPEDIKACNSEENPNNILPHTVPTAKISDGILNVSLEPFSWNVIRIKVK